MLISEKQHEANIRNAQHSTGPQTPEGKQAVRFNALKHGLRAAATILPMENAGDFNQLCESIENEWNPQTDSERRQVEQMAIHQWLLLRLAHFEASAFMQTSDAEKQLTLMERFSVQRTRLENSYSKSMRDLIKLQKNRPKRRESRPQTNPIQTAPEPQPGHTFTTAADTR